MYSGRKLTIARVCGALDGVDQLAEDASLPSSIQCRSSITLTIARAGRRPEQAADDAAQRPLARLGAQLRRRALGIGHSQEVEHQRQVVGEVGVEQEHRPAIFSRAIRSGSRVVDAEVGAQHLQHRQERDRLAVRLSLRLVDLDAARPAALGELVAEAALADARVGDDADHPPSPALARASAASSTAISSARPTKRERPRSRETSSRERAAPTPASSKTCTGRLTPLISNSPRSFSSR